LEERVGFGLALGACLMGGVFLVEWAAGWVRVTGTLVTREGSLAFWPGILVPKWRREMADARLWISRSLKTCDVREAWSGAVALFALSADGPMA